MSNENELQPLQIKEIPRTLRPRAPVSLQRQEELSDELHAARSSWYSLWYRALRLSDEYKHCCANNGKGRLKPLYTDFGDVVDMSFFQWWQRVGRYLFAERKVIPKVQAYTRVRDLEEITHMRDRLVLEIPLNIRKSTVIRQVNKFLKDAYEGREVVPREQSTARRKLMKSKLRKDTVRRMLDLYELKLRKPDLTLWQLGEQAGIELDLLARSTTAISMSVQQERIRMGIAVSRYLNQARNLIWNATEGQFPSIRPLVTDDVTQ
jgi:hypothetical protein